MSLDRRLPAPRRAVIVGAGRMGSHHARIARTLRLETFTVDPSRPADFRAFEDAPRADIVAIATPIGELAASALAALGAGCRHVLVEKPLAASLADAETVVDRAAAVGARLSVGYTERFDPGVEMVRSGLLRRLGKIRELRFERRGPRPSGPRRAITPDVDLAVHDVDLIRHLGFRPTLVEGSAAADRFAARLDCGRAEAYVDAAYEPNARVRRFTVRGDAGRLECDLVGRRISLTTSRGTSEHRPAGPEPLLAQWRATLDGEGPDGRDGVEVLAVVLSVTDANARRADPARSRPRLALEFP
jgi:predicted dehydrogenase